MIGDSLPYFVNVDSSFRAVRSATSSFQPLRIPYTARIGFKIADGESPRPIDRVIFNYQYFNNVGRSLNDPLSTNVHAETFGFEKTFLDKNASIGMRVPVFQQHGDGISRDDIGDLSVILKYAVINDPCGNVLSGGLVVTTPTGPDILGLTHSTLLQPWVGTYLQSERVYFHGFTSVVIPTTSDDATLLFIDVGVGYYLLGGPGSCGCPDNWIRSIAPTLEAHATIPLDKEGIHTLPIGVPDIVDLTAGVQLGLGCRGTLNLGVAFPVTGPQIFDVEAIAQFNYRF
jgi:hypothetical protein